MAQAKRKKNSPTKFERASERNNRGIRLDVTAPTLRDLMTEQSRVGKGDIGWATYYEGSGSDFVKTGLPSAVFPVHDRRQKLRINGRDAFIQKRGHTFELTLTWDYSGPWYHGAAHPALSELARMISVSVGYWADTGEYDERYLRTDEVPTQKLIDCGRAVDYRLPATKRFRFGQGVQERIRNLAHQISHEVHNSEIFPCESVAKLDDPSADRRFPRLRLVK